MDDVKDYCWNCKWLEDRSDGKFVNSGRCKLYGIGLGHSYFGYKKCEQCVKQCDESESNRA